MMFKQNSTSGNSNGNGADRSRESGNGEKKRTLTYGDSFGDLGIVYNAPRSASVLALTDC